MTYEDREGHGLGYTVPQLTKALDQRTARVIYLERLLDRAYIWLHNPYTPQQSAKECARFDALVNEIQLVIQHLKDEDDPPVALPCASCDGKGIIEVGRTPELCQNCWPFKVKG